MGDLKIGVKVGMTRDYGITTVSFEAYALDVPFEGSSITNDLLTAGVLKWFKHFEDNTLKDIRGAAAQVHATVNESPAERIVVNMKKGKKLYNVIGGKFQEFGIPFYEEHMKQAGINPAEISDDGEELPERSVMIYESENGKAKRVLRIEQR